MIKLAKILAYYKINSEKIILSLKKIRIKNDTYSQKILGDHDKRICISLY